MPPVVNNDPSSGLGNLFGASSFRSKEKEVVETNKRNGNSRESSARLDKSNKNTVSQKSFTSTAGTYRFNKVSQKRLISPKHKVISQYSAADQNTAEQDPDLTLSLDNVNVNDMEIKPTGRLLDKNFYIKT